MRRVTSGRLKSAASAAWRHASAAAGGASPVRSCARRYPAWPMTSLWPSMLSTRLSARAQTTSFQGKVATTSGGQTASRRREASRQPSSPFTISMRLLIGSIRPTYEKSQSYGKMPDFAAVTIRIVQVVGWPLGVIFGNDDAHPPRAGLQSKAEGPASEVYGSGMDFIGLQTTFRSG